MDFAQIFFVVFVIILFEILAIIGIFSSRKQKAIPGIKYLILALSCFTLLIIKDFLTNNWDCQDYLNYHRAIFIFYQVGFILPPMIYFYIQETAGNQIKPKLIYIHLTPSLIALALVVGDIYINNVFILWTTWLYLYITIAMCIVNLIYIVFSVRVLVINDFYFPIINKSSKQKINALSCFLLITQFAYWLFKLTSIYFMRRNLAFEEIIYTYSYIVSSLIIFIPLNIFVFIWLGNREILVTKNRKTSSFIDKKDTKNYLQQLIYLLEVEKQFKDSELTLNKLSNLLNINPRYLSHIINNELNKSFNDLVNSYRIKESELILINNPEKTVQEIMFEVGFNSKSTFNTLFRNETGTTPKEYRIKNLSQFPKIYN